MDLLPSRHVTVPSFVREALGLAGAEWDEPEAGVLEVLLPGSVELRRVTFEPEIAREERETELAAHGSPFVEALAGLGFARGHVARAFLAPPSRPPPALARAYRLRAPSQTRSEWADRPWTTWIFAFLSRTLGEFRRDALHFPAVDAASLRIVRRFEEAFARFAPGDSGPLPEADRPFEECCRVARTEALQAAEIGFRAASRDADDGLARELERLGRYYGGLIEEMNADMERAAPEDPRRTAILSRLQAVRAERDRAAAQARERHALSLEVEAVGALAIVYPRCVAAVTLADERKREVRVEVAWDPVLEQFEAIGCPSCGRPTYELELRGGKATCGCR